MAEYEYDPNHHDSGSGLRGVAAGVGAASAAGAGYAWHTAGKINEKLDRIDKNVKTRANKVYERTTKTGVIPGRTVTIKRMTTPSAHTYANPRLAASAEKVKTLKLGSKIGAGVAVLGIGGALLHKATS